MRGRLKSIVGAEDRTVLLLALGTALLFFLSAPASSQEWQGFHLPDSLRVMHDPFFVPPPSLLYGNQFSSWDQAFISNEAFNDTWKRSFLIGASTYRASLMQPATFPARKQTLFQSIQAALGVATLAGAAYLGYKAIKHEPITKKKK
jgi:hypothetical protein